MKVPKLPKLPKMPKIKDYDRLYLFFADGSEYLDFIIYTSRLFRNIFRSTGTSTGTSTPQNYS